MELKDFSYHLPEELIAQHPCEQRDRSRMMLLQRDGGRINDCIFSQLPNFLQKGDVLVVNNSRVIPARLAGFKPTGASLEILLLSKKESTDSFQTWEVVLRPAKRLKENDIIALNADCEAKVLARISEKKWLLRFDCAGSFDDYLKNHGRAPLPPYVKRKKNNGQLVDDLERYQTIYAENPGSIAAPTAGLHFSPEVIQSLQTNGIQIAPLTLHVGFGTFLPIEVSHIEDHVMEPEYYDISAETAGIINNARRVIAVGTTSTRTLESIADEKGVIKAQSGFTNLFIYPGHKFRRVNGLLTNFHLPQSSLFILVCTFAGTDFIKKSYAHAVDSRYHFYSYGDCMLIL
ncbi:MAG: tRNA preQ1(34) S-adenosylmethionine ribosyltransferase-isomerase QueA [Deltaproteobacteria bacterium HGW-Deltaproteobacteria-10]|nr:MAG: tRNA preQ1(34) S-adenosylmethionine ribosyltransferase-isomerase QueA [Deltaproteobacteria bacterium HGW-Deltaproteobacteria-10]